MWNADLSVFVGTADDRERAEAEQLAERPPDSRHLLSQLPAEPSESESRHPKSQTLPPSDTRH